MNAIVYTPWVYTEPPEVTISPSLKIECSLLECGWSDYADDEDYAIELRRNHREWHEDGCHNLF
jgi:hypothetical protein